MAAVKDTVGDLKVVTVTVAGPVSYATGGILVDASTTHNWLGFIRPTMVAAGPFTVEFEILLNRDLSGAEAFGKAVLKLVRQQFDQATSGSVTSQPAGVTVQAALANTATSTHTHDFTHSHGTVTSAAMAQAGTGSAAGSTPDELGHTHVFTPGAATVTTTPAGGSHSHPRPFEYDHTHTLTTAATDVALAEVANGTDLSAWTFKVICVGFGSV